MADMIKLIHLTDTHLVKPGKLLHGLDPESRFVACMDSISQHHHDAECCVITGDIADHDCDEAYVLFAEQIRQCPIPCYPLLGNHDDRQKFLQHFPMIEGKVTSDGFVQYTVTLSEGVMIMLDTVKSGFPDGEFCEIRQQWLHETLIKHQHQPVYLFMHHPPFDIHIPCLDEIGLAEKRAFSSIIRPNKNIRHLFFGHAHRPISGNWQGISFSSLHGTNHQIRLDFNSQEFQYIDEPPQYSVVFLADQTVVVHTHAYLSENH